MVAPCLDGGFTVFINDQLSPEGKLRAYAHALRHIERGDFESDLSADEIERRAHDGSEDDL